jgi:hypothetical protein
LLGATLIVENLETFYALTPKIKQSLLIWGGGWRLALIRGLLDKLPRPLYYWGDIDKEGYEIYGYLKNQVPEVQSLFMDRKTLRKYASLHRKRDLFEGPFRNLYELQDVYEFVCREGLQVEQEKLSEPWPFCSDLL